MTPILLVGDLKQKEYCPDERSIFAFLTVLRELLSCVPTD